MYMYVYMYIYICIQTCLCVLRPPESFVRNLFQNLYVMMLRNAITLNTHEFRSGHRGGLKVPLRSCLVAFIRCLLNRQACLVSVIDLEALRLSSCVLPVRILGNLNDFLFALDYRAGEHGHPSCGAQSSGHVLVQRFLSIWTLELFMWSRLHVCSVRPGLDTPKLIILSSYRKIDSDDPTPKPFASSAPGNTISRRPASPWNQSARIRLQRDTHESPGREVLNCAAKP